jgi:CBS domain-containing protein
MKVSELMSVPAVVCTIEEPLSRAAQLMWDHDCGAIPVVATDGRLLGIVTDRDVCMAAWTKGQPLHSIAVATAMSRQVFSCHAQDTVEAARRTMREKRVHRLPVVDDSNRPIGLLSTNDLARQPMRSPNDDREFTQTLATICQPRVAVALERVAKRPALVVHAMAPT